nr:DMT family transporter [Vibrio sonorensis]
MLAFAGNSILCRLALAEGVIDAGSFTQIRLLSGALTLLLLTSVTRTKQTETSTRTALRRTWSTRSVLTALMLFGYAVTFSFSYVNIATGTGALILFACVQFSMVTFHLASGNRMTPIEWLGLGISLIGFAYLLLPDATRPDLLSALLMAAAGIFWAVFTVLGKQEQHQPPVVTMTHSFCLAALFGLMTLSFTQQNMEIETKGALLASASGAITSGLGYAIWYAALPKLSLVKASVVQLSVPALASIGGWVILTEPITYSTSIATLLILGGIAIVFVVRDT